MSKQDRRKIKVKELIKDGSIIGLQDGNHGGIHPKSSDFINTGIPFVMSNNIKDNFLDLKNCNFISPEIAGKLRIGFSKTGDVLLTHKGTVGSVCIVPILSTEYIMLTPQVTYYRTNEKKLHNKYLKFFFLSPNFQGILKGFSAQSTRPYIGITAQKDLEILLPPLPTQQRIASILSKYDDLIENNNKRIKILEQEAELIYKEWFVKFKFPGHEKVKMIDSGIEFGEIPEEWEVKSILDVDFFRFINENIKSFTGDKLYLETANIDGINIVGEGQIVSMDNKPSRAQKQPIKNSVWFARMSNSYKVLCFSDINKDIAEKTLLSSGMIGFETNEDFLSFLFFTINTKEFHKIKDLYCTGSTQVSLTNEGLEQIKIVVPKVDLIKEYGNICNKLVDEILSLQKQNDNLRKTRDMLLPKLIGGEVEV